MATLAQLTTAYTTITRTQPSAAQTLVLTDLATRSSNGTITDAQAYAYVNSQAQATTSVAALSYQFFTGKTPTAAGFDYLVNSTTNTSDLNDAYYQNFNLENRYINFSINLGVNGEGRTAFSSTFGSLSFADTVRVAYERIIGTAQAQAAGINVQASIDNIVGRQAYFAALAASLPAADRELGTKAAVVGYILAEATKANVGVYVTALNNFYTDAADGTANFNVDLTTSYGTGSGGAGDPGIPGGVTINYATAPAGTAVNLTSADTAFRSTAANDTVSGGTLTGATIDTAGGNDVITGLTVDNTGATVDTVINTGVGADTVTITLSEDATATKAILLEGGAGTDTLNVTNTAAVTNGNAYSTTISGFETINFTGAFAVDADSISGATAVWANGAGAVTINDIAQGQFTVGTKSSALLTAAYDAGTTAATVAIGAGGTGGVTVTGVAATGTTTVTASANATSGAITTSTANLVLTGGVELNLSAGVTLAGAARSIDASALSRVALTYTTGGTTSDTITLTGGNDVLTITNLAVLKSTTINLGAGSDLIAITDANNLDINSSGVAVGWAKINGFTADDTLDLTGAGFGTYVTNATLDAAYIGNSTLEDFLADAAANLAANEFTVFTFNGSTYIYLEDATDGVNDADGLIQLVGVTGLTVGAAATNDILV
ncbi:hypothetical protein P7B02_07015 [Caulobacter segnis]|uniref:hypothetical protein n=1 Tax=Caulobacter segnis TaxID=88688 RepID=UPI00240FA8E5|nr:hypothetical protein [Caulobacter segnis]MDG2521289.1 hypothetical protein [Caulobacter segnis]